MTPFQPKRPDGRSISQVGFEYLTKRVETRDIHPGQIIRHQELASEMGVDYPSSTYFQALAKITRDLQRGFHLSLVSVRGVGYQLVEGMGLVDKGRAEHGRARRQISKAVATVDAVDEGSLTTADERNMVTQVRRGFAVIAGVINQQAEQLAQHDEEIRILKSARMDDRSRIAAVEEQIRRITSKVE